MATSCISSAGRFKPGHPGRLCRNGVGGIRRSFPAFHDAGYRRHTADVAAAFGTSSLLNAGFEQTIDISNPKKSLQIMGWAIDFKTQEAFPMNGTVRLERGID